MSGNESKYLQKVRRNAKQARRRAEHQAEQDERQAEREAERDQHNAERERQNVIEDRRVKDGASEIVTALHRHERWLKRAAIAGGAAVFVSASAIFCTSRDSTNVLNEMQAEQRALLKVELTPVSEFAFNRSTDGSESPGIYIKFTVTNLGKTPAMLVTQKAEMHDGWLKRGEIGRDQTTLCTQFTNNSAQPSDVGYYTIFPGDHAIFQEKYALSPAEMKEARGTWRFVARQFPGIVPVVYGCIGYKTTIDNRWHQTDFVYSVAENPPSFFLDPAKGDVKLLDLVIIGYPLVPNGFFAD